MERVRVGSGAVDMVLLWTGRSLLMGYQAGLYLFADEANGGLVVVALLGCCRVVWRRSRHIIGSR